MEKLDKKKLSKVNGGELGFDVGGGNVKPQGLSDGTCQKGFDSFSCNGCPNCNITYNPSNPAIKTFVCKEGYYGTIVFDMSLNKITNQD